MPWSDRLSTRAGFPSPYWGADQADALMRLRFTADAEQAKQTGGMVALYPRSDDARQMSLPGGEPVQDLHLTLAYLGEDVSQMDPGGLSQVLGDIAHSFPKINARVMGHATFNPDGGDDGSSDPCAVYIISDSEDLDELHREVRDRTEEQVNLPTQHTPWLPHVTAGYALDANRLTFTGQVTFDRIGLRFAGQSKDFPLL